MSWPTKTIHSLKLTFSSLKMDGWNTTFLLERPIFRCYVSFRECNHWFPLTRPYEGLYFLGVVALGGPLDCHEYNPSLGIVFAGWR